MRIWSLPEGRLTAGAAAAYRPGRYRQSLCGRDISGRDYRRGRWLDCARGCIENIFLFDRASGELKQRLTRAPNVVIHLAYSPDGRRLAASLGGNNGIRVFDAGNDYRLLPSDTQYGDGSPWRHSIARDDWSRRRSMGLSGSTPPTVMRRRSPVSRNPDTDPIQRPFRQMAPASRSVISIPTTLWSCLVRT